MAASRFLPCFVAASLFARSALAQTAGTDSAPNAAVSDVIVQGARASQDSSAVQVNASDARHVAGTQGDPVKVIESLPGVAHTSMSAGPLILWGASPYDSRTFIDGVEIPKLFHGANVRSTINGEFVQDVVLTPGAFGPEYGRAIGGIVTLKTKSLPLEDAHASFDVNTLDGSAYATSPVTPSIRAAVGGRYGWLDRLAASVANADALDAYPIPRYRDAQAKMEFDLRDGEGLDLVWLGARDSRTFTANDANPVLLRQTQTNDSFERWYARYHRRLPQGERIEVVPWIGRDSDTRKQRFGKRPADLSESDWRWGLHATNASHVAAHVQLNLGADIAGTRAKVSRRGSLTIPAREGDVTVFGQPPGDDFNVDTWSASVIDVGPYAQVVCDSGPLTFTPSLRWDGYLLSTSRQTPRVGETPSIGYSDFNGVIAPRAQVEARLSSKVRFLAAAGRYSQPPTAADLSAVFGSPKLGPSKATHATFGEVVELSSTLSVSVTAFYEHSSNLPVRDDSPNPRLAQALVNTGVGRSYGVQTFLRQKPIHGFYFWLASTVSRSERQPGGASQWRLFDYDEPLLLTLVVGKRLGNWSLSSRFRYARGSPRTPVIGAFYVETDNIYQPIFGAQNSTRLPDFWQLDMRLEHALRLSESVRLQLYLEGLNVTSHTNGEDFVYDTNYSERGTLSGLPLVGIVGARLEL